MWNGLPSIRPLKTTDLRRLIGNSGLVISVGLENVGTEGSWLAPVPLWYAATPSAAQMVKMTTLDRMGSAFYPSLMRGR